MVRVRHGCMVLSMDCPNLRFARNILFNAQFVHAYIRARFARNI